MFFVYMKVPLCLLHLHASLALTSKNSEFHLFLQITYDFLKILFYYKFYIIFNVVLNSWEHLMLMVSRNIVQPFWVLLSQSEGIFILSLHFLGDKINMNNFTDYSISQKVQHCSVICNKILDSHSDLNQIRNFPQTFKRWEPVL